jgi:hypothetical protein
MDNAKRYFIHINKFGNAAGPVLHSMSDVKKQQVAHHEFVKAEELTYIKDKINTIAAQMKDEYDKFDGIEVLYFVGWLKELAK